MLREMTYLALQKAQQALIPIIRNTSLVEVEPIHLEGQQVHKSHHKSCPLSKDSNNNVNSSG